MPASFPLPSLAAFSPPVPAPARAPSLGAASKPITRQVKRRCPLAVKLKKQQNSSSHNKNRRHHHNHYHRDNSTKHGDNHAGSGCSKASGRGGPGGGAGCGGGAGVGAGAGGGGGDGSMCKHKKGSAASSFSPGTLCRGARGLGLDLGGFQAVIVAAAEVSCQNRPGRTWLILLLGARKWHLSTSGTEWFPGTTSGGNFCMVVDLFRRIEKVFIVLCTPRTQSVLRVRLVAWAQGDPHRTKR